MLRKKEVDKRDTRISQGFQWVADGEPKGRPERDAKCTFIHTGRLVMTWGEHSISGWNGRARGHWKGYVEANLEASPRQAGAPPRTQREGPGRSWLWGLLCIYRGPNCAQHRLTSAERTPLIQTWRGNPPTKLRTAGRPATLGIPQPARSFAVKLQRLRAVCELRLYKCELQMPPDCLSRRVRIESRRSRRKVASE